uniref:Uncharacterized protein n=1 Tax=Kalanchoe fedtschenkoi TaxID=63787 RepID=A0A7N0TEB7_KALFE
MLKTGGQAANVQIWRVELGRHNLPISPARSRLIGSIELFLASLSGQYNILSLGFPATAISR